ELAVTRVRSYTAAMPTSHDGISVIIPAFNAAPFLKWTLDSVRAQTHPATEIVVVDDGSTDGTVDLVCSFGDDRVRVISQINAGQAAARNRGIREATQPYLAFLDADDLWHPDKLRYQMRALHEHPGSLVSACAFQKLYPETPEPNL